MIPVGKWDPGVCRRRDGRGNAGNDLAYDPAVGQELRFLSASTEDERIAAFKPHYDGFLSSLFQKKRVDVFLGQLVLRRLFARVDKLRLALCKRQEIFIGEIVVNDDVCKLDKLERPQRNELEISGACAYEVNFTHMQELYVV